MLIGHILKPELKYKTEHLQFKQSLREKTIKTIYGDGTSQCLFITRMIWTSDQKIINTA